MTTSFSERVGASANGFVLLRGRVLLIVGPALLLLGRPTRPRRAVSRSAGGRVPPVPAGLSCCSRTRPLLAAVRQLPRGRSQRGLRLANRSIQKSRGARAQLLIAILRSTTCAATRSRIAAAIVWKIEYNAQARFDAIATRPMLADAGDRGCSHLRA